MSSSYDIPVLVRALIKVIEATKESVPDIEKGKMYEWHFKFAIGEDGSYSIPCDWYCAELNSVTSEKNPDDYFIVLEDEKCTK